MWVKNTNGKKDAMLTFAAISFGVVTLNVLLSSFDTITLGNSTVVFKSLDSSVMAIYLGSTFTAYVSRRWTDRKYHRSEDAPSSNPLLNIATSVIETISSPPTASQDEVALSQIEMQDSIPSDPPTDEVPNSTSKRRKPRSTP